MKFNNVLKETRIEQGYLQKDIAKYLNVRNTTVSNWEKGMSEPDIETLIKLSNFFNVSISYLIGEEDNKTYKTEIQELYDQLDDNGKRLAKSYIQGILDTQKNLKKSYVN